MRHPSGMQVALFCAFVMNSALSGCDSSPDTSPPATSPTSTPTPEVVKEAPLEVAKLAAALHALSQEHQAGVAAADLQQMKSLQTQLKKRSGSLVELLTAIYPADESRLRFVGDGLATPAYRAMAEAVQELPSHGIALSYFPAAKLESEHARVEQLESEIVALDSRRDPALLPTLRSTLLDLPKDATVEQFAAALKERKVGDSALPIVVTLAEELKAKRALYVQRGEALNELELFSMESFLEYACEFLHGKVAHPFRAMRNRRTAFAAFDDRLLKNVEETDFTQLKAVLEAMHPNPPVYDQIREGLAKYERIAAKNVQTKLGNTVLKPGDTHPAVHELQARLLEEEFFEGEHTGVMDAATVEAVKRYQVTHQLDADGVVGGGTIRSLNVSFERRVAQLKLGLTRWRESEAKHQEGFFIRVNLPEFEAQFWDGTTLERAHRVVIGSNAYEVDEDRGIHGKLNRTVIFSDEMERLVLNPLWHVPARIKETELDLELIDEPDFYEKNNYTVQILDDGTEVVYQNSGPWNALGQVKFLFPNDHSIYLHDTPKKALFKNRIRAYSHGCMRVHNALDLAEYLLVRQDLMTPQEMKKILDEKKEKWVNFKEHIPVHIDYNSIGVTSEGDVIFLIDIYEYDKEYFEGNVPLPTEPAKIGEPY